MKKYRCPCCGYYAYDHEPDGTYDICPVCFWEDDPVALADPGFRGGANGVSLREARENYLKYRACPDELFLYARVNDGGTKKKGEDAGGRVSSGG